MTKAFNPKIKQPSQLSTLNSKPLTHFSNRSQLDSAIILAIDPGYDRVGWAVGIKSKKQPKLINLGLIQTKKEADLTSRYLQIIKELNQLIQTYRPSEVAIERLYFAKNVKTAIRVAEARGLMIGLFLAHNLSIFEYDPTEIKQTVTGYGRADKRAVAKMIKMQLKVKENLVDDAIDAAACYLTCVLLQ